MKLVYCCMLLLCACAATAQAQQPGKMPPYQPPEKPGNKPPGLPKPAEVTGGLLMVSEMWFINHTPYTVTVHADRIGNPGDARMARIKPGDTALCGDIAGTGQFLDPAMFFSIWVQPSGKRRHAGVALLQVTTEQGHNEKQKYYYTIQ